MKKTILLCSIMVGVACLMRCNNPVNSGGFAPVPFPQNLGIAGFNFPEPRQNIDGWLTLEQTDSIKALDNIYNHGWGIWAGLTQKTTDTLGGGDTLLVFETWDSPGFLQSLLDLTPGANAATITRIKRNALHVPNQFIHAKKLAASNLPRNSFTKVVQVPNACPITTSTIGVYPLLVTVAYNAPAANHILTNKLYDTSVLTAKLIAGADSIPEFPDSSISIKPTYEIIPKSALGKAMPFRIWTGPNFCINGFGQNVWSGLVYIDNSNSQNPNNSGIDSTGNTGPNNGNTYNLNQFIYYVLTQADADSATAAGATASAGDYAILVGMHVTTKEIERWTWQSYFWTPNVAQPAAPSDPYIASRRPAQITGAPAHYAMAIGYTFAWPNQPFTGGTNIGNSIYSYNPFLEAGFSSQTFAGSGNAVEYNPKNRNDSTVNLVGCATNCMSCHALASYVTSQSIAAQEGLNPYIPDTYIDMLTNANFNDPNSKYTLKKKVRVDFLWSIADNLLAK